MKGKYFIIFCTCLTILEAYPMDYDEAAATITRQALEDLSKLVTPNFQNVQVAFQNKKAAILNETQEKLQNVYDTFNQYQQEIQSYAQSSNSTDISRCYQELEIISPYTFLDTLNATCDSPGDLAAFNLRRMQENKRGRYFHETYFELSQNLENCLNFNDPQPYICAGLVASTLQEVLRLSPSSKVQPLQFNGELNQQLIAFSECATYQVAVYSNRLNVWHSTFITCVEDLVNWIYK